MIKGTIFDADGTILDSMGIWKELGARYLLSLGIKPQENLAEVLFPLTVDEGCLYLKENYNLSQTPKEIKTHLLTILSNYYKFEVKAKDGIKQMLSFLKEREVPCVIATSGDKMLLKSALERLELMGYFKNIFTCEELNTNKREPKIYEISADFLGFQKEEIAVFEDALFTVQTAKNAGFTVFAVKDNDSLDDEELLRKTADFFVSDFNEALKLIKKMA